MGIFKKLRKTRKHIKHSVGKAAKKVEKSGEKAVKKVGKEAVKAERYTVKHPFKVIEKVGELGELVGGGLEIVGAFTGQPELIAAGMGIQAVGSGASAIGAIAKGDIAGAAKHAKKAHSSASGASGSSDTDSSGTSFIDTHVSSENQELAKQSFAIGKKMNKFIKKQQKFDKTIISQNTHQIKVDKHIEHDISRVEQTLEKITQQNTLQNEVANQNATELSSKISHLDEEEQQVVQSMNLIQSDLDQMVSIEKTLNENIDNTNELLLEDKKTYKNPADFKNQIDQLDNFEETLQFLVRKQTSFDKLPVIDQARIIRQINLRF